MGRAKVKALTYPYRPYLSPGAIGFFALVLQYPLLPPWATAFEWGSGGSTIWLAERCRSLVSIEHDPEWHHLVEGKLHEMGLEADLRFVREERYAEAIGGYPDKTLDLVFVDGIDRTRSECVARAIPKVKPGGWLILDDTHWAKLKPAREQLAEWPHFIAIGYKDHNGKRIRTQTTFYRRET